MKPQIIKADLDDILFENREKSYGAYPLRKKSGERLMWVALSVLSFIVSVAMGGIKYLPSQVKIKPPEKRVEIEFIAPARVLPHTTSCFFSYDKNWPRSYRPVSNEKMEEDIIEIDSLLKPIGLALEDIEGGQEETPDIHAFIFAEEEPKPINIEKIRKILTYPAMAKDAEIYGQVVFRILVDKKGNYKRHKVIKKVHPLLVEACEKHIPKLKFTPAMRDGKPIPFWINIPFKFSPLR